MKKLKLSIASVMEEIVFGVEDSLVSTMGVLVGVAAGTQDRYVILLTGIVLLMSEALSMAAGSYLSSKTEADVWLKQHASDWDRLMRAPETLQVFTKELRGAAVSPSIQKRLLSALEHTRQRWLGQVIHHERSLSPAGLKKPTTAGIVMGVSYVIAGCIPLSAYLLFPVHQAVLPSVLTTLAALFLFGATESRLTGRTWWKSGAETVLVASLAAAAAYGVGRLAYTLFHIST